MNNGANNKKKFSGNKNYALRKSKEEYEAEKAEKLARQGKNLDMIEAIASYLNTAIGSAEVTHITMRDVLTDLCENKGYAQDDTKAISQFSYIMVELANARKNDRISGDRKNIRVMYIEERLKTSFKRELHERIANLIKTYNVLFQWDDEATAEDYNTLE